MLRKMKQAFFATYFQHNKKNGKNCFLSNTEGSFNSMDNTTLTIITQYMFQFRIEIFYRLFYINIL